MFQVAVIATAQALNISKLARRADLGVGTVRKAWHNRHVETLTIGSLDKMAAALGVPLLALFAPPPPEEREE